MRGSYKKYIFQVDGKTDTGTRKKVNEDSFVYKVVDAGDFHAGIFAVADGVGGLKMGDMASGLAIAALNKWWEEEFNPNYRNQKYLEESLNHTINKINSSLLEIAKKKSIRTATTLTILFLYKKDAYIFHTGDSRVYRFYGLRYHKGLQLTNDFSCTREEFYQGIRFEKNYLTECLGNKIDFLKEVKMEIVKDKDILLICSDGLYKTLDMKTISKTVNRYKGSMETLCENLIHQAKQNGETDNITVIAVKIRLDERAREWEK